VDCESRYHLYFQCTCLPTCSFSTTYSSFAKHWQLPSAAILLHHLASIFLHLCTYVFCGTSALKIARFLFLHLSTFLLHLYSCLTPCYLPCTGSLHYVTPPTISSLAENSFLNFYSHTFITCALIHHLFSRILLSFCCICLPVSSSGTFFLLTCLYYIHTYSISTISFLFIRRLRVVCHAAPRAGTGGLSAFWAHIGFITHSARVPSRRLRVCVCGFFA